jgi:hypothetical protein
MVQSCDPVFVQTLWRQPQGKLSAHRIGVQ